MRFEKVSKLYEGVLTQETLRHFALPQEMLSPTGNSSYLCVIVTPVSLRLHPSPKRWRSPLINAEHIDLFYFQVISSAINQILGAVDFSGYMPR